MYAWAGCARASNGGSLSFRAFALASNIIRAPGRTSTVRPFCILASLRLLYIAINVKTMLLIAVSVCAAVSCSPKVQENSAAARADRLNTSKQRAADLIDAHNYLAALDVLVPLSEEASGDQQVFVMLGDTYQKMGEVDKAVASYESAIRLAYAAFEPHLKLATLLMHEEKTGRALTEFELALRYGDRSPVTHYNYGLALFDMAREEEALAQWRLAHDMEPSNAKYAEAVGMALAGKNDREAATFFEQADAMGASGDSFDNNYGLALQRLGRHNEARQRFEAAVAAAPEVEEYRFNLAGLYMRSGDYASALASWEQLVERFGRRWSYSVYLARTLLELRRFQAGLDAVVDLAGDLEAGRLTRDSDTVDRMPPDLDEALAVVALCHRGLGNGEQAMAYIRSAVELSPDNVSHLNNYAVILAENGMIAEAKAQWRRVLELDDGNATARANLSTFDR